MKFYEEKFREARKKSRWTTVALAKVCEVTRQTIALWEKGKIVPPESKIKQLAKALNLKLSDISDLEDNAPVSEKDLAPVFNTLDSLISSNAQSRQDKRDSIVKLIYSHLSEQEELRSIINALLNSQQPIFYFKDKEMKYLMANRAFLENSSLAKGHRVRGKTDFDFFPKGEANKNNEEDLEVFKTGKALRDREGSIPGSGKKKWGLISKYPVMDDQNRIIGVLGNIVDITKIREYEISQTLIMEALKKIDATVSIIREKLASGYSFWTGSMLNVFGIKENFEGKDIKELVEYWLRNIVHPDDREEQRRIVESGNVPPTREYRIIHPDKGLRTIKVIAYKTSFKGDKYNIVLSMDVTRQDNSFLKK